MACYHPKKAFKYGKTQSGKDNYIICNYKVDHIEVDGKGSIHRLYSGSANPAYQCFRSYIEIPCGKCIGCRLDHSKEIADRCFLEMQLHDENCFITLTYDDDHLPKNPAVVPETGEIIPDTYVATLEKKDLSDFIKALRNKINYKGTVEKDGKMIPQYYKKDDPEFKKILFIGSGEYGDSSKRPHLHLIIFGWSPVSVDPDLKVVGKNISGDVYYSSEIINSLWKKGYNVVSNATYETCSYVARYVTKKAKVVDPEFFEKRNIQPEFVLSSKRPAIGKEWYNSHKRCYASFSFIDLPTLSGNKRIGKIRYFDRLMEREDDDPDLSDDDLDYRESLFKKKIERRMFKEEQKKIKMKSTDLSYLDLLKSEETVKKQKIQSLVRNKV